MANAMERVGVRLMGADGAGSAGTDARRALSLRAQHNWRNRWLKDPSTEVPVGATGRHLGD